MGLASNNPAATGTAAAESARAKVFLASSVGAAVSMAHASSIPLTSMLNSSGIYRLLFLNRHLRLKEVSHVLGDLLPAPALRPVALRALVGRHEVPWYRPFLREIGRAHV